MLHCTDAASTFICNSAVLRVSAKAIEHKVLQHFIIAYYLSVLLFRSELTVLITLVIFLRSKYSQCRGREFDPPRLHQLS
jgi:hypothetical protein